MGPNSNGIPPVGVEEEDDDGDNEAQIDGQRTHLHHVDALIPHPKKSLCLESISEGAKQRNLMKDEASAKLCSSFSPM